MDDTIILSFNMDKGQYTECIVDRHHWEFVEETADRFPVLVAKYCIEQGGPTTMFWRFPPPIGADHESYRYYIYTHDSSEIAESLVDDILQSQVGRFLSRHAHRARRWL